MSPAFATPAPAPATAVLRRCGGVQCPPGTCDHDGELRRHATGDGPATAPPIVHRVLAGPGAALDPGPRHELGSRLGHDFSRVQVHTGAEAAESADAVRARAYTVGEHIVFGEGEYRPATAEGRRLLAHELTHTVQSGPGAAGAGDLTVGAVDDPAEHEAEAVAHGLAAVPDRADVAPKVRRAPQKAGKAGKAGKSGKASACSPPKHCPKDFCAPYDSVDDARLDRDLGAEVILLGIGAAVNDRVVPLWRQHIYGGAPPQNLTSQFGADFAASPTTARVTKRLTGAFLKNLADRPPRFGPADRSVTISLADRIAARIDEIGRPGHRDRMNFNVVSDIAGNIAGDIADNQSKCRVGAQPSPLDDQRLLDGRAVVTRNANGSMTAVFDLDYTVIDTVDLCPGDCGTDMEQIATVPISQWEATGISGDVPFTVKFKPPATKLTTRKGLVAPPPKAKKPPSGGKPGPAGPSGGGPTGFEPFAEPDPAGFLVEAAEPAAAEPAAAELEAAELAAAEPAEIAELGETAGPEETAEMTA